MQKSREVIDSIIKEKTGIVFSLCPTILFINRTKRPASNCTMSVFFVVVVYGITTGFGKFARTIIPVNKLE